MDSGCSGSSFQIPQHTIGSSECLEDVARTIRLISTIHYKNLFTRRSVVPRAIGTWKSNDTVPEIIDLLGGARTLI